MKSIIIPPVRTRCTLGISQSHVPYVGKSRSGLFIRHDWFAMVLRMDTPHSLLHLIGVTRQSSNCWKNMVTPLTRTQIRSLHKSANGTPVTRHSGSVVLHWMCFFHIIIEAQGHVLPCHFYVQVYEVCLPWVGRHLLLPLLFLYHVIRSNKIFVPYAWLWVKIDLDICAG